MSRDAAELLGWGALPGGITTAPDPLLAIATVAAHPPTHPPTRPSVCNSPGPLSPHTSTGARPPAHHPAHPVVEHSCVLRHKAVDPAQVAAQRLHDLQVVQLVPLLRKMHLLQGVGVGGREGNTQLKQRSNSRQAATLAAGGKACGGRQVRGEASRGCATAPSGPCLATPRTLRSSAPARHQPRLSYRCSCSRWGAVQCGGGMRLWAGYGQPAAKRL